MLIRTAIRISRNGWSISKHVLSASARRIAEDPKSATVTVVIGLTTSPAVHWSLGDLTYALHVGEPVGITIRIIKFVLASGLQALQSLSGKELGLPFSVLAVANLSSCISILYEGYKELGIQGLAAFDDKAREVVGGAFAYFGWGVGNGLAGYHKWKNTQPRMVIDDEWFHYGYSNMPFLYSYLKATLFGKNGFIEGMSFFTLGVSFLGLAKTLATPRVNAVVNPKMTPTWYLWKHSTPARLQGIAFLGASLAPGLPLLVNLTSLAFGTGSLFFDDNKILRADTKELMALMRQRKSGITPAP